MLWLSYGKFSREGIQGMIAQPHDRSKAVSQLLESYGGKLISYHMLLNGDIDFVIVSEIPEEKLASIALVNAMLVRGSGAIESITTLPALSAEDTVPQMIKAKELASAYKPPTQS